MICNRMKFIVRNIFFLFIFGLLVCSCSSRTNDYSKIVNEWQGKKLIFPDFITDFVTGDTINLSESDFNILTFVDSVGCAGCKMKLNLWMEFLEGLDSIAVDADFKSVLIVNAKSEELLKQIERDSYSYPIVNDTTGYLYCLNRLCDEDMLRTFLVDKEKRIIAVGSPVLSYGIAELFRDIISGSKVCDLSTACIVSIEPSKIYLGEVSKGTEYSFMVRLNNLSSDTVRLRKIVSSCSCTEVFVKDSIILPKSELPVNVKFKEDTIAGDFIRTIHFYYHDFENPSVLGVSSSVE